MIGKPKIRCAVYTRKSTEDGLDQEFNSLDAQRESCVAFIASQSGLGWRLIDDRFDDGGISGGTMERPALQRLLQQVRDRRIDVIVVYKIDRLTRSLMDFSKIVEVFDNHTTSFVSVTQQFNTTTSMGRLTLNVLLSFAQFEREVTAERIRDKIAASRKKGIWMGGTVPMGYRAVAKKLVVDEVDAAKVRSIYVRYMQLKSVNALCEELNCDVGSPIAFTRGKLYGMLSNPVYIGKARHRDQVYDGEHVPIIDRDTFDGVQKLLKAQAPRRRSSRSTSERHLLTGIIFDETGDRLAPVFTTNHGRRYRYYVSSRIKASGKLDAAGWRVPAHQLEAVATHALCRILEDRAQLSRWIHELGANVEDGLKAASRLVERGPRAMPLHEQDTLIKSAFRRVILEKGALRIEVQPRQLILMLCPVQSGENGAEDDHSVIETIEAPFLVKRRGVETRLVIDRPESSQVVIPSLVKLVGKAHLFLRMLTDGTTRSLASVATITGTHIADVSRALPLAFLAPDITQRILSGRQPGDLTARDMLRADEMPVDWSQQRTRLGA